jgi:Tfp pilus assembly protein PilF
MNAAQRANLLINEGWQLPSLWEAKHIEARTLLEQALADRPDDTVLLTCYGAVLSNLAHHGQAVKVLKRAITLGSLDRNTFFNLGVAVMNHSTQSDAMPYFDKAKTLAALSESFEAYFDPHAH